MRRFIALLLLSAFTSGSFPAESQNLPAQNPCQGDRNQWVAHALEELKSIKVGMTRKQLLEILTTEGGISTRLNRTYVSRECPYFKLDVEFKASGQLEKDKDGRFISDEDGQDTIVKLSRPYLDFSISD